MNKIIKNSLVTIALIAGALIFIPVVGQVSALDMAGGLTAVQPATGPTDMMAVIKTIIEVIMYVLGAVSVIMLVIGGVRYVVSAGNATAVTAAKNTIMYAIIGLIVAILAYAIVNFVVVNVK